jgi:hypothetical protein
MNNQYSYGNMFLWDDGLWEKRNSHMVPLFNEIAAIKAKELEKRAPSTQDIPADASLELKINSYVYPEAVKEIESRGYTFRATGMGQSDWMCIAPKDMDNRLNKRGAEPEVLVVIDYRSKTDKRRIMQLLDDYKEYTDMIINEGKMVVYFALAEISAMAFFAFTNILQEVAAYYHTELTKMYLDVSPIIKSGKQLQDINGLCLHNVNGGPILSPDSVVAHYGALKIPAIDISGQWYELRSLTENVMKGSDSAFPLFDNRKIIHSQTGKQMCEGFALEYFYDTPDHPELLKKFDQWGIDVEAHNMHGDQWYTVMPKDYDKSKKLPLMLCLVEVSAVIPHRVVTAFSNYYEYLELAASGDLMLVMFALEDVQSNEKMYDIYHEVLQQYPADPSRVYLTGFSHNSELAMYFAYQHRDILAGFSCAGHSAGVAHPRYSHGLLKFTDEMIENIAKTDLPTINICGVYENDLYKKDPAMPDFQNLADSWQRRLKAHDCPIPRFESIAAAQNAGDYITQMTCIPSERKEIQMMFGLECFILDYANREGKHHFRLGIIGDQYHTYTPQMPYLSWNFLRRFSRDMQTMKIVELW